MIKLMFHCFKCGLEKVIEIERAQKKNMKCPKCGSREATYTEV